MTRNLETRLQRLERIAAMSVISPERAAQARQKLAELLDTIAPGLLFLEQATCPAIPVQALHSHYMDAGQQKAQRVRLG